MERPSQFSMMGVSGASSGGYLRKFQLQQGEAKCDADKRRAAADRNAYIAFLEEQVERSSAAALEAESSALGLRQLRSRVEELEERGRNHSRSLELIQGQCLQTAESSRADRHATEEQLKQLELRFSRFELQSREAKAAADADVGRLRNETCLAVQELAQRLDDRTHLLQERMEGRVQALQAFTDQGASAVIRNAQATCVRLADDALGAAEAAQRKGDEVALECRRRLEELSRDTQASLESLREELRPGPLCLRSRYGEESKEESKLADAVERRLSSRLGQQVIQLSDVLRQVVQSQAVLQQQLTGGLSNPRLSAPCLSGIKPSPGRRRDAVDELYRELWQLETSGGRRRAGRGKGKA